MRCPSLKGLQSPKANIKGWPWTEESPYLPDSMPDGNPWPKITVVTPSYNQGEFIEETIRSILLQGYPNLEYIIVDGGSTDGSPEIIKRYSEYLTRWVVEPDEGQSDAINKALAWATGEWFNWINSDDLLAPGALGKVAMLAVEHDAVAGACENFSMGATVETIRNTGLNAVSLITGSPSSVYHQPSVWLRLDRLRACGGIKKTFHYVFDWEMTVRYLADSPKVAYTNAVLSRFRLHPASKTVSVPVYFEHERRLAMKDLRASTISSKVASAADVRYRQYEWWAELEDALRVNTDSRLLRAGKLIQLALREPNLRLNRMTVGAIRKILFGAR